MKTSLIQSQAFLMGSPFSILVYPPEDQDPEFVRSLIGLAFGEVRRIEDLLTDFRASSFNRINEMAGIAPVEVSPEIWSVLETAMRTSRDSNGAFDISYASVGHLWREAARRGEPPPPDQLQRARRWVDYRKIHMDPEKRTVFLPHSEMRIGLGGIGKGYAVDRAYEFLRSSGLENLCVNGAGDIRVHTASDAPRPWRVGVRNPLAERDTPMGLVELGHGAIATSGDYERFFRYRGEKYHHVFDGRTGDLTEDVVSVTVVAPMATTADLCATTTMALGPEEGIRFLNRRGNVSGFLVTKGGEIRTSSNWKKKEAV